MAYGSVGVDGWAYGSSEGLGFGDRVDGWAYSGVDGVNYFNEERSESSIRCLDKACTLGHNGAISGETDPKSARSRLIFLEIRVGLLLGRNHRRKTFGICAVGDDSLNPRKTDAGRCLMRLKIKADLHRSLTLNRDEIDRGIAGSNRLGGGAKGVAWSEAEGHRKQPWKALMLLAENSSETSSKSD
ncbi:hypothetical protein BUALT_Bualt16G0102800 [Buddleja alternifolia]|uniref:Uncharacterized protein n=1 Tax=Buddleja alternifolia TaxID=168488 RepID=A0AAV6WL64_9LAMI|nr:hypothetical protein BUALT_Bualt16G0102800 [Buddleja alternifolia]